MILYHISPGQSTSSLGWNVIHIKLVVFVFLAAMGKYMYSL